ncbi:MAG: ABC transporter permease [Cyanobacteriota bacterium]|nr:ABC transporter permease [Cyanobacteriota bacterium]
MSPGIHDLPVEADSPLLSSARVTIWQRTWWRGWIVPIVLLVIWQTLGQVGFFPRNLLPTPSAVLSTLQGLTQTGEIWGHIGITLQRVAIGFVLGSAAATGLGVLTGYSRWLFQLLDPLLQALRSIPSLAWVPLFILWMGIYETSKVVLIAVGVFFPVYLNLVSGIQTVDRKLVEVGRIYRLKPYQLMIRVFFPATLPAYMVGLRGGLGLGWMFVVAAELMGASQGLGYLLVDGQTTGRADLTIASILLFAIFGKATDALIAAGSHRLLYWQDAYVARG